MHHSQRLNVKSFLCITIQGTSHFNSFFSVNGLAGVDFWYDNYGLWP